MAGLKKWNTSVTIDNRKGGGTLPPPFTLKRSKQMETAFVIALLNIGFALFVAGQNLVYFIVNRRTINTRWKAMHMFMFISGLVVAWMIFYKIVLGVQSSLATHMTEITLLLIMVQSMTLTSFARLREQGISVKKELKSALAK